MENQHRKISGYRELSQAEIDLMNRIKAFGPELEKLCRDLDEHITDQYLAALDSKNNEETERLDSADPGLWLSRAKGSLQAGLMYATRSVAQPTFF